MADQQNKIYKVTYKFGALCAPHPIFCGGLVTFGLQVKPLGLLLYMGMLLVEKNTYTIIGGLWLRIGYFGYVNFLQDSPCLL